MGSKELSALQWFIFNKMEWLGYIYDIWICQSGISSAGEYRGAFTIYVNDMFSTTFYESNFCNNYN